MRVDPLDNTLICHEDDLQRTLRFHQEDCVLPPSIELGLLNAVCEAAGIKSYTGDSVKEACGYLPEKLLSRIIAQINDLFRHSTVDYAGKHLAYLLYYLPANIYKVWKPMSDLLVGSLLKANLRVLDVGTGPGSIPVGIIEFYKRLAASFPGISLSLDFNLVDHQVEFLTLAKEIIDTARKDAPGNLRISVSEYSYLDITPARCSLFPGNYDIISLSNVLTANEGGGGLFAEQLVQALAGCLARNSTIIVIEPGDERSGGAIKKLRNNLINGHVLNLYAPCVDVWNEGRPYNCACFNPTRCFWSTPTIYGFLLEKGVNRSNRAYVPFHYAVFRNDEARKYGRCPSPIHYLKLKDLPACDGQVVNVVAMVRSAFDGKDPVELRLCDGTNRNSGWSPEVRFIAPRESLRRMGLDIRFCEAERLTLKKVQVCAGHTINLYPIDGTTIEVDY